MEAWRNMRRGWRLEEASDGDGKEGRGVDRVERVSVCMSFKYSVWTSTVSFSLLSSPPGSSETWRGVFFTAPWRWSLDRDILECECWRPYMPLFQAFKCAWLCDATHWATTSVSNVSIRATWLTTTWFTCCCENTIQNTRCVFCATVYNICWGGTLTEQMVCDAKSPNMNYK